MTTPSSSEQPAVEQNRRNPRLLILLLFLLCGLFIAGYIERLTALERARQEVDAMMERIAASQQRRASLLAELQRVQDPHYLALQARDLLGLAPEGELPVVVYDAPTPSSRFAEPSAGQTRPSATPTPAPWRQWLELVFPLSLP
jgi:cell division protein FtsB